jgi:hypothetical protein
MSTDRTKPVLVGTTRPVESRSAERQSALDGRHVHDHTRAALDHGGEEPPIEPDGGVQVLVDGLLPELIRGGLETPTRRGRAPTLWTMTSTPLKRSSVSRMTAVVPSAVEASAWMKCRPVISAGSERAVTLRLDPPVRCGEGGARELQQRPIERG